jgi:hypothetical protein
MIYAIDVLDDAMDVMRPLPSVSRVLPRA